MDNKSKRETHHYFEVKRSMINWRKMLFLQEDEAFLRAVSIYSSEDINAIQAAVQTRSKVQIRNRVVKVR